MTIEERRRRHRECNVRWRREHPEHQRESDRRWKKNNREQIREANKKYERTHPGEAKERNERQCKHLGNTYVKKMIHFHTGIVQKDIPNEIVPQWREYLLVMRQIRKAKEMLNGAGS